MKYKSWKFTNVSNTNIDEIHAMIFWKKSKKNENIFSFLPSNIFALSFSETTSTAILHLYLYKKVIFICPGQFVEVKIVPNQTCH